MKPRCGARLVRSCSHSGVSTSASRGRDVGCVDLGQVEVRRRLEPAESAGGRKTIRHDQPISRDVFDQEHREPSAALILLAATMWRYSAPPEQVPSRSSEWQAGKVCSSSARQPEQSPPAP